jgi:hypothetical protein
MASATFWFSRPFRDWIGRPTLHLRWEGRLTLRQALERFAADHPVFRMHVSPVRLTPAGWNHMAAVLLDGDFLDLESEIPDGAHVDVLLPLTGGGAA